MAKRVGLVRTRKTAGYTQESFAEALGVDRSTVARWEAGDHEPLPYVRPKMARLLDVSRDELNELLRLRQSPHVAEVVPAVAPGRPDHPLSAEGGLLLPVMIDGQPVFLPLDPSALTEHRERRTPPMQDADGLSSADRTLHCAETSDSTLRTIAELSGGDLRRRDLLIGAAFTAAAFVEPALLAMTRRPPPAAAREVGNRHIGMTDVEILTDSIAHLRRLDFRHGSGRIRERAVQVLHHEATTLLRGSYSDATGKALLTAVAQAARLTASMAADVGRHALAQRYYIQALNLAMNAGNRLFAAIVLSDMSLLTIQNATGHRCARQAVALARAGTMVAENATPTLAAQLSAVEARRHALCQDASATRTAVLDAQRHYERFRPDGEPAWLSFYTEAELAADLGRALQDSEPEHAASLMTSTLGSYETWRVRSRCFVQTDLATVYLADGDHEHAATLTRDALNTATHVSSGRTVRRIRALQQQIQPLRCAGLAALDEEITTFLRRAHDDEDITT